MRRRYRNYILFLFILILSFSTGFTTAYLKNKLTPENVQFQKYLTELFTKEVQSNTLHLHYTLAHPALYGIRKYPITFGTFSTGNAARIESEKTLHMQKKKLSTFSYESLSLENQIIYDTLALTYDTETDYSSCTLLYEPLSPTLGIQAQLPILLAEYTFRCEQDLEDYLNLLTELPSYFESIIQFEKEKARNGLFMSKETANRIITQCENFSKNPDNHYLLTVFQDKLKNCSFLSQRKKDLYQKKNKEHLTTFVLPSYKTLAKELFTLLDFSKNTNGLYYFPNGQKYYLSLLKTSTGIYDSIETITKKLYQQMHSDFLQLRRLLTVHPDLPSKCQDEMTAQELNMNPEQMLEHLKKQLSYDFPDLEQTTYSIKYVHKDLAKYLSPAFYLTPPIDTLSPNAIYINPQNGQKGLSLYSTLAHEGFPGHLYQTLSFAQKNPHPIRHLLSNSGFIEGWATYIESYAYQYAPVSHEIGEYMSLQRSFYLCVYSLLDIYIHYYGWTFDDTADYLNAIGITDEDSQKEIFQILLEDPANYLKYCLGSLYIKDLKAETKQRIGSTFEAKDFHDALLTLGPLPFPILKKYLPSYLKQ